jgi:endonuclease/exonuclease/phosphatase family metal-dependent hydrolase
VYGEACTQDRHIIWELLRRLKPLSGAPWMLIGDFNEAMWSFEHFSGRKRPERQMLDFREVLSHYDVHDLVFYGVPWTFDNKQAGGRNVKVRLDRAVASSSWTNWFPSTRASHLMSSCSDHLPILLEMDCQEGQKPARKICHYEIMWECDNSLPDEI